ncbi:hypothetical protein [Chromobacterium alticapitis]|uniref:Uncharacterized protein n=1 Tax=Chromobacterium alticapitis TaxID=2073169 RepID=A0A2S5DLJ3_9NEIS|nr:hypothetical protein [Chromobacterium alticapitis]POZ63930.1 hypothetical protein C2I19_00755 [Chromobacterium alticapitis]
MFFPWFWIFAPQIHLPFSGNVLQDIDPATYWLNLFTPWWGGRWQWHDLKAYRQALEQLTPNPAPAQGSPEEAALTTLRGWAEEASAARVLVLHPAR